MSVQQRLDLREGAWRSRLCDLRLADSSKSLAEQRFDSLDPAPCIRKCARSPAGSSSRTRGNCRSPTILWSCCRSLEQDAADRLDFLGGGEARVPADSGWAKSETCDLSSSGSEAQRLRDSAGGRFASLAWSPLRIRVPPESSRDSRVMLAKVSPGRHRAATTAVAKRRGTQRSCDVDARSVTPSILRACARGRARQASVRPPIAPAPTIGARSRVQSGFTPFCRFIAQ